MVPENSDRLQAVDALRGLVMAQRLISWPLVPAVASLPHGAFRDAVSRQIHHTPWHGLSWIDFSFAGYVMLMGLSISLSLRKVRESPETRRQAYSKILRRSGILFALGVFYNGGFTEPWPDIRLMGVLQRLAICYVTGAILFLHLRTEWRNLLLVAILGGYWAILAFVPVPGGSSGDFSFEGNLAAWTDSQWLPGRKHFGTWDPEGLLTTLPAIGSCLVGMLWGDLLQGPKKSFDKVVWLAGGGLLAINVGCLWDLVLPINKSLWTSSYVVVTAGIGSILLAGCYLVADVWQRPQVLFPFVVIGRNLLVAFLVTGLIPLDPLVERVAGGDVARILGAAGPFFAAGIEILFVWLLLHWMYVKGIVIKI
tara:strand:- start:8088 stop:9188 length:1101 start_codon:yes stop_codon:yes gene_type:complete